MKLLSLSIVLFLIVFNSFGQMVSQFSWSDRHGKNYTTPPKDQKIQGPCHAFAAIGMLESVYMLYFNETGRPNFSEQYLYSNYAQPEHNPLSTAINYSLDVILDDGIIDEACYPYIDEQIPQIPYWGTRDKCTTPNEVVNFGGYKNLTINSANKLKQHLIKYGPIALWFKHSTIHENSNHAYTLIGWKTVNGQTKWELQDSWPGETKTWFTGVNIANKIKNNANYKAYAIDLSQGPITSSIRTASSRTCEDLDGDGYYNWGIGPKPSSCPSNAYSQMDGDDTDCSKGPLNNYGIPASINGCGTISANDIVVTPNSYQRFCPNTYYTIYANAEGATQYQFTLSGQVLLNHQGHNFVQIKTLSNFGRLVLGVRAKANGVWTGYRYEYYYLNYSGCGSSYYRQAEDSVIEESTIKEELAVIKSAEFEIYPIPSKGLISINAEDVVSQLRITDLNGRLVFNEKSIQPNVSIDISQLKAGIYITTIFDGARKIYGKLLVEQ